VYLRSHLSKISSKRNHYVNSSNILVLRVISHFNFVNDFSVNRIGSSSGMKGMIIDMIKSLNTFLVLHSS